MSRISNYQPAKEDVIEVLARHEKALEKHNKLLGNFIDDMEKLVDLFNNIHERTKSLEARVKELEQFLQPGSKRYDN